MPYNYCRMCDQKIFYTNQKEAILDQSSRCRECLKESSTHLNHRNPLLFEGKDYTIVNDTIVLINKS